MNMHAENRLVNINANDLSLGENYRKIDANIMNLKLNTNAIKIHNHKSGKIAMTTMTFLSIPTIWMVRRGVENLDVTIK